MLLADFRKKAVKDLSVICASPEEASVEADLLIEHFAHIRKKHLLMEPGLTISEDIANILEKKLKLRFKDRVPLQYIINRAAFFSLDLYVEPGVLIPRPDTEVLVEQAIAHVKENNYKKIAEIGAGSGCISIALLKNTVNTEITATDISDLALEVSRKNAQMCKVDDRLDLIKTSFLENVDKKFDMIVSNPPYIPLDRKQSLQEEVKKYEPSQALFVDTKNPVQVYDNILEQAKEKLVSGGMLIVEIDSAYHKKVSQLFESYYYRQVKTIEDYSFRPRVISGIKTDQVFLNPTKK